jgi:TonB family protein
MHAKVLRWFTIYLSSFVLTSCVTETPPPPPPASPSVEPLTAPQRNPEPVVFTDEAQYIHAFRIYVRRNLTIPPGTPGSAAAAVEVVVSPKGEVRKLVITQSSGYSGFDRAIERAVHQAQPLPVMQEWVVSNRSEKLILKFKASE